MLTVCGVFIAFLLVWLLAWFVWLCICLGWFFCLAGVVLRFVCVAFLGWADLFVYFVLFNSVGSSLFITWSLLVLFVVLFGLRICI